MGNINQQNFLTLAIRNEHQGCTSGLKFIRRVGLQAHYMGSMFEGPQTSRSLSTSVGKISKHIIHVDLQGHQKASHQGINSDQVRYCPVKLHYKFSIYYLK